MPQPLIHTKGRDGQLRFDRSAIESRPNLAYLIAQAISTWAYAEANLGNVLAAFLRAESTVTMEMYSALNGFADQRRILVAAARTVLQEPDLGLLEDTLTAVSGLLSGATTSPTGYGAHVMHCQTISF